RAGSDGRAARGSGSSNPDRSAARARPGGRRARTRGAFPSGRALPVDPDPARPAIRRASRSTSPPSAPRRDRPPWPGRRSCARPASLRPRGAGSGAGGSRRRPAAREPVPAPSGPRRRRRGAGESQAWPSLPPAPIQPGTVAVGEASGALPGNDGAGPLTRAPLRYRQRVRRNQDITRAASYSRCSSERRRSWETEPQGLGEAAALDADLAQAPAERVPDPDDAALELASARHLDEELHPHVHRVAGAEAGPVLAERDDAGALREVPAYGRRGPDEHRHLDRHARAAAERRRSAGRLLPPRLIDVGQDAARVVREEPLEADAD